MALNSEQLAEIKSYMDARAENWRSEAQLAASEKIDAEIKLRDDKAGRRWQLAAVIGGVTLAGLIGGVFSWVSTTVETRATLSFQQFERTFREEWKTDTEARRVELEEELEFLATQVTKVVDARSSMQTALNGANETVEEAKLTLEELNQASAEATDAAETARFLTSQTETANAETKAANEAIQKLLQEVEGSFEEIQSKIGELAALEEDLEAAKTLVANLDESGGDIVRAVLAKDSPVLRALTDSLAIPSEAVIPVADRGECPTGWSRFTEADDRVLLGAGGKYEYGSFGGEETVTLTVEQMPSHTHELGEPTGEPLRFSRIFSASAGQPRQILNANGTDFPSAYVAQSSGKNQPHNNMPPYIALYFCKKD